MGRDTRKVLAGAMVLGGMFVPGAWTVLGMSASSLLKAGGLLLYPTARRRGKAASQDGAQVSTGTTVRPLPVVYGTARFGVSLVDVRVDESSTNDKDLWIVAALCHGGRHSGAIDSGINDVTKVWFDDRLAVDGGVVESDFSGYLDYYEHDGTDVQNVDANINAVFPTAWPATSKGRQVAYLVLRLTYDRDVYPNDMPNIVVEVEGNQVYDTRDSQWKFSINPALCVRDYLLSDVYGCAVPAAKIDDTSFEAAANYCDELVSVPDGAGGSTTQKRFEANGALDPDASTETNLDALLSSCRGRLVYQGGKYRLVITQSQAAETFELDASNIVGDWEFFSGGIDYAANVVRAQFIDAAQDYRPNEVRFPEPGAANSYLTADNDFESSRDLELPMTTDYYMAQQICQVVLNESRQDITCAVTVKEEALKLEVGSVVKVTAATPGWDQKQFWVDGVFIGDDDLVRLLLREYDSSAYSYFTMSDKASAPDTNLPNPFDVAAPTGLTLLSDATTLINPGQGTKIPRIKVTWTRPDDPFVEKIEVLARLNGGSDWAPVARVDADDAQLAYVLDVDAGETWEVGVRSVNTLRRRSALVTDTVVVSAGTFSWDAPSDPSSITLAVTVDELEILD